MPTYHSTSTAQVDCIQSIWATHFANLGSTSGKHFSTKFGSNCCGNWLANLARLPANLHRPVSASVGLSDWVAGLDDLFGLLGWLVGLAWLAGLARMAAMAQTSLHCFGRRANVCFKQIYLRWPCSQQAMASLWAWNAR